MKTKTFTLYKMGPDNRSTYPECWGAGNGPGRKVAEALTLRELASAIEALGHDNWAVEAPGGWMHADDVREALADAPAPR